MHVTQPSSVFVNRVVDGVGGVKIFNPAFVLLPPTDNAIEAIDEFAFLEGKLRKYSKDNSGYYMQIYSVFVFFFLILSLNHYVVNVTNTQ